MPSYNWRAAASADDAGQQIGGGSYSITGTELRLVAHTTNSSRRHVGIRFNGTIPAGTIAVQNVSISGFIATGTLTGVNCKIYLQKTLSSNSFRTGTSAGVNDVISRTKTTASVDWVQAYANGDDFTTPDLQDIFKELLEFAGAVFADVNRPYIATTATSSDIVNPVIIFEGTDVAINEIRLRSFDSVTNVLSQYKIPTLKINIVPEESILIPSDRRTHIAILSDSIGWALQPGQSYPTSRMSFVANGSIYTNGLIELEGVPGGMVSVVYNGQAYTIDDPYGGGGAGSITLQGREGFTTRGVLKDKLMETFGVADTDIIMHSYGLGGTTVAEFPRSQGIWSSQKDHTVAYESLADIPDPSADLSATLTNPLWNYVDETGHTLLELLRDTSIERLLIIFIGGGNDTFNHGYGTALIPMSRDSASWATAKAKVKAAYKDLFRFCRAVRLAEGGSDPEFILAGYPNFSTDDPRIAPRVVTTPVGGAFHRGSFPAASSPDTQYGGASGTDGPGGGSGPYMAPYGSGSVNVIPHIPWFLAYSQAASAVQTNIPGVNLTAYGALPRRMFKGDLGMFLQVKAFNCFAKTFNTDYTASVYGEWYSHWGADHYGASFAGLTNADKWTNGKGFFVGLYNTYPYSASLSALPTDSNVYIINTKIAVSYCTRYITNQTVNEVIQYVTGEGGQEAMDELAISDSMQCQYVNLFNCLGADVGSGVTASAGTWAFLDGIHLTEAAAEMYCEALIARARLNSNILQTLTDWSYEATARFFNLFTDST